MAVVLQAIAWLLLMATAPLLLVLALHQGSSASRLRRLVRVCLPRRRVPAPPPRSLREVTEDVRRISAQYHRDGMRFAQYEGRRQAFDRILGEAATMLEIEHLLGVLPPGGELDRERRRVESALAALGVLPQAAGPY